MERIQNSSNQISGLNILGLAILLPILICSSSFSQNSHVNNTALITQKYNSKVDTSGLNSLLDLAWDLAPTEFDKSISYADSAIVLLRNYGYDKSLGKAYNIKGEALRNKGLFNQSLKNHEKALKVYGKLKDEDEIANTYNELGKSYFSLSNFSMAFKSFDEAKDIYEQLDNKDGILNACSYMGVVFSNYKQHDKALEYFNKALNIAAQINNRSKIGTQLNNIALTYVDIKDYKNAITYYKRALKIFSELEDDLNFSIAVGNIGIPYMELKDYDSATKSFKKSLKLAFTLNDNYGAAHQYGNLGEMFFKRSKEEFNSGSANNFNKYINEAIKYLKLSVKKFESLEAIDDQKDYLFILSNVYNLAGNYKSSLLTFKEGSALKDSIQSKTNEKIIAGLEIKQELNNKEKEIKILNQDKEYQAMLKTTLSVLALLLLIIAILIFYFYRRIKRHNSILEKSIIKREEVEQNLRKNEIELKKHKNHLEELVKDRTSKLEHEIEGHKETEKSLLKAIERAEVANNAKSVFLANMSHELRTPLVGILGYSDLLAKILDDEEAKMMAQGINRTGNRLLNTLSLILDLARIESDKYEIQISDVDIIGELEDTYLNFKATAEKKKLSIKLETHTKTFIIPTDPSMIKVVLDNLVNNAVKFTQSGEITIASEIENNDGHPNLLLKVSDTGVGIKKDDISKIFEEFKQLSEGFTKDFQGSGLGLSITKKFVQLLGGRITVVSESGKGTTFTISFPIEAKAVA